MALRATRAQIVEAADRLFYEQGYAHTSFTDIADAVGISRGNFYYHFKTKDEILDAVIARRMETTQAMLARWEADGDHPAQRIESFITILIANQTKIMAYGCPVGTLCAELAKLDHAMQDDAAGIFTLFRNWLSGQFAALGSGDDADRCAMHLLARSQGVAAMANAFHDEDFIAREVEAMCGWLAEAAQAHAGPHVHAH